MWVLACCSIALVTEPQLDCVTVAPRSIPHPLRHRTASQCHHKAHKCCCCRLCLLLVALPRLGRPQRAHAWQGSPSNPAAAACRWPLPPWRREGSCRISTLCAAVLCLRCCMMCWWQQPVPPCADRVCGCWLLRMGAQRVPVRVEASCDDSVLVL